jgi:hypothetical protein
MKDLPQAVLLYREPLHSRSVFLDLPGDIRLVQRLLDGAVEPVGVEVLYYTASPSIAMCLYSASI